MIVNQVKSSQSSQQIFERLPGNYVNLKSSRHLVIYNSFLYSQVCKNDQLCHCEGGFDPKDGCASGVTDIFMWIITRTTCAQPPRADPQELAFFGWGLLSCQMLLGGDEKRGHFNVRFSVSINVFLCNSARILFKTSSRDDKYWYWKLLTLKLIERCKVICYG